MTAEAHLPNPDAADLLSELDRALAGAHVIGSADAQSEAENYPILGSLGNSADPSAQQNPLISQGLGGLGGLGTDFGGSYTALDSQSRTPPETTGRVARVESLLFTAQNAQSAQSPQNQWLAKNPPAQNRPEIAQSAQSFTDQALRGYPAIAGHSGHVVPV